MVTLKDVAHEAGVSISTVSAVLGGRAKKLGIKEETCRRIQLTAERLRYRRNAIAAQMKSGRANTLILILNSNEAEFVSRGAAVASSEAERHGLLLKLLVTDREKEFRGQLDAALGQRPAGLLHWDGAYENADCLRQIADECNLPLVYIDFLGSACDNFVCTDDRDGIRQAVRHLVELGHRRIAHVTDVLKAHYADTRFAAYREALQEFGLPFDPELVHHELHGADQADLVTFLRRILSSADPATAISCGSDFFALNVMTHLQRLGVRIPEEVSVVGYGDLSFATWSSPTLTSVRQPIDRIGAEAITLTLALRAGRSAPLQLRLPTELIRRGSTGPVKHGEPI